MYKKLFVVLFLSVFLAQLIGFNVYFFHQKAVIKKEIKTYLKRGVPKNQLLSFNFTKKEIANLNWIKPKKEFKIKERYYDVVWVKKTKANLYNYLCVDDIKETKLFVQLAKYVDKNLDGKNTNSPLSFLFKLLQQPVIVSENIMVINVNVINAINKKYFNYHGFLSEAYKNLFIPPPNFC